MMGTPKEKKKDLRGRTQVQSVMWEAVLQITHMKKCGHLTHGLRVQEK